VEITAVNGSFTAATGDTAFKVTATGGSLIGSPKVYLKDDGSDVRITATATAPSGYTDISAKSEKIGSVVVIKGLTAAAATGDDDTLKVGAVTVTLAADAQSAQVTNIGGLSKVAVVLYDGTYTLVGTANSTTNGQLNFAAGVLSGRDQNAVDIDETLDAHIDQDVIALLANLQTDDEFTIGSGVVTAVELKATGTTTAGINSILGLTDDVTLGAALTTDANITVPSDVTLTLDADLTIGSSFSLTVTGMLAGSSVVKAEGTASIVSGGVNYTTTATGVAGSAFDGAITAIATDTGVLTTESVDLSTTFGGTTGIGSVTLNNTSATKVTDSSDGTGGTDLALTSGIAFATGVTLNYTQAGTDEGDVDDADVTVGISGTELQVTDSGYSSSTTKNIVLIVSDAQLQISELVGPVLADFHIGVVTER
jgi:hypothetical protein